MRHARRKTDLVDAHCRMMRAQIGPRAKSVTLTARPKRVRVRVRTRKNETVTVTDTQELHGVDRIRAIFAKFNEEEQRRITR